MSAKSLPLAALAIAAQLTCASALASQPEDEARGLNELRNTVVNLLQTLVERGIVTREQAEAMVSAAQKKAATDAEAVAAQEVAEANAVRVPYVPQIVKEEIRKQLVADLAPEVTREVAQQAKSNFWGMPEALPDWIQRTRWSGDIRVRGQGDLFAPDNFESAYLDFNEVNGSGGIARAGSRAFLNVSEDRKRLRARLRVGLESELGAGWHFGARLTTGNLQDPVSTNQTLGNTGLRYQTGFDLAYLNWYGNTASGRNAASFWAGRMPDPWLSTPIVFDEDLTFEGIAANYRLGLLRDDPFSHFAYLTIGAFPLQEVDLSPDDKWLFGGQLGLDWNFGGTARARFAVAYYQYENITGKRNALNEDLLDYTAPQFMQRGNTLFDIRNDDDLTTELYALATKYHLANATMMLEWKIGDGYRVALTGDYVKNIGYDRAEVFANTGLALPERTAGYNAEINFGSINMQRSGAWRAYFGYRYVGADAVLDAFTDSDFSQGATDVKGYIVGTDYSFTDRMFGRLRYLTSREIDGLPLGIDIVQLDFNASF